MNHKCKNFWFNVAGGEVCCDLCGEEYFFTDLGITAYEIIHAGGYDTIDETGIPEHDQGMIKFFVECEQEYLERKRQDQSQLLYEKCINEKLEFPQGVAP